MDIFSLASAAAIFLSYSNYNYTETPTIDWTELNPERWWGPADEQSSQDTAIYEYTVKFDDDMITDLKDRLNNGREVTPPLENIAFQYGFNTKTLANWTNYWANVYDFSAAEANFNKFPLYKTNIQGMDIVYIRVTPNVTDDVELIPLLLLHGWPTSIRDFYDVIPMITEISSDRNYAVDLIVPCLPGFGFSEGAVRPGMGVAHIAVVMRNLMRRIGYGKYYLQGGDYGASINAHIATIFPDEVLGFHTNRPMVLSPVAIFLQIVGQLYPPLLVSEELYSRMYPLVNIFKTLLGATGYMHMQATRPDTLGIMFTDSPQGLLAWLFEKFATANKKSNYYLEDGGLFDSYEPDFLIDSLMYYWINSSIQTSMRLYAETLNKKHFGLRLEELTTAVPTWVLQADQEYTFQSQPILSLKYTNILKSTVLDHGGHLLALDEPDTFTTSVLEALTAFREYHAVQGTDTSTALTS